MLRELFVLQTSLHPVSTSSSSSSLTAPRVKMLYVLISERGTACRMYIYKLMAFQRVLAEITAFDPLSQDYTRNRRELEGILLARLRRKMRKKDPSEALLHYALNNICVLTDVAIRAQTPHFTMLALVERATGMSVCWRARMLTQIARHVPDDVRSCRRVLDLKQAAGPDTRGAGRRCCGRWRRSSRSFADGLRDEEENTARREAQVSYGTCIACQEDFNPPDFTATPANLRVDGSCSLGVQPVPAAVGRDARHHGGHVAHLRGPRFGLHTTVYNVSIWQRHHAQVTRHPENIPRKVLISPLCKSLWNVVPRGDGAQLGVWERDAWGRGCGTDSPGRRRRATPDGAELDAGERGAGISLPQALPGYVLCTTKTAQDGVEASAGGLVVDTLTDARMDMDSWLLTCTGKLAGLHFPGRFDEGRESVKKAAIKRLLPEWSQTSLTSFSYPFLILQDPFTVLIETAAAALEMLLHLPILAYYLCLVHIAIDLGYVLNAAAIFSDHAATLVFETFSEQKVL
ncbi:hypothetical protein FB451DRAFT_1397979 [Mycena latifolia]|nr:hypothetical protein FB451DRAFT_1397979 [Mycena latifolia]